MTVRVDHYENNVPFYHYTGTFLHQPVDLVSPGSNERPLRRAGDQGSAGDRQLVRSGESHPDEHPRRRSTRTLTTPDVISKITPRDGLNSTVTSWLLGGVADDELNTDENNAVIHDIGIENANPELGIPEDTLVIGYTRPAQRLRPAAPPAGRRRTPESGARLLAGHAREHRPHRRADDGEPVVRPHARLPEPAGRDAAAWVGRTSTA